MTFCLLLMRSYINHLMQRRQKNNGSDNQSVIAFDHSDILAVLCLLFETNLKATVQCDQKLNVRLSVY